MVIDRRYALGLIVGGAVGGLLPSRCLSWGAAASDRHLYLSARSDPDGGFRVSGFSADRDFALDLLLPGRGHSFAVHPDGRKAVHFARRPGHFALVLDLVHGTHLSFLELADRRHFYGHGVYSHDGRFLYATENDFLQARGVIGVYDAKNGYRRIGEFPSHGIGPHEVGLLSNGTTLVVANGGIATRPDLPRVKLNLPTMEPTLCYINRLNGQLLQAFRFESDLHQLSIRHLAVSRDDTVAIAMQYEGPSRDLVPLVAVQHGRDGIHPLEVSQDILRAMKNYCGSVCFDQSGQILAVSAPRGNLVTFWDVGAGCYLSSVRVTDGSGVAPGSQSAEFLVSSSQGDIQLIHAQSSRIRSFGDTGLGPGHWDNHLVVVPRL